MAYTRPWTRDEERAVKYCGRELLPQLARKLHRSTGAVIERWKRCHRSATVARKRREGVYGLLPADVPMHDPQGIICAVCGDERHFWTDDGRTYQECRRGRAFVPTRLA